MIQTGLIQNAHSDLVTDASYDFYGLKLATCSLDQRIKIWQLDEANGTWSVEDDWKAHDAAVSRVSWAHPEFGTIIASSSFDRTVKIWEHSPDAAQPPTVNGNGSTSQSQPSSSQWVERAVFLDARGTVRAVEFAPRHFGLKLATISTDNFLRIYECLEQPSLATWLLSEEIDIHALPSSSSVHSRAHTVALATPTQTSAPLEGASPSLVAQALLQQQGSASSTTSRPGPGSREADGGWCLSWCKDRYWGEVIAAGCGITGIIKIIQLSPSRRPTTILVLDPSPLAVSNPGHPEADKMFAVTTVSWAPSCGRSYHLIATGGRDGHVRIWKVKPAAEDDGEQGDDAEMMNSDETGWSASLVGDFDEHQSTVGRVEWNVTGTVLSSAGNDGRVRLWKAALGGSIWRPAGSIGVEQSEESGTQEGDKDDDMQS
ncbi:WD40 repeat-like protein [Dendrothele bispora CBS 962.96]|uniref:WD40 repeat-like protein n=1 Tax=Dendrothele bispora (strain CBS 962.96) TaxID=1314807 RepID=A0A4S8MVV0_DENBC|nr:WD40 repeat-like protein [Dendrothele bispora CBS 962.96]